MNKICIVSNKQTVRDTFEMVLKKKTAEFISAQNVTNQHNKKILVELGKDFPNTISQCKKVSRCDFLTAYCIDNCWTSELIIKKHFDRFMFRYAPVNRPSGSIPRDELIKYITDEACRDHRTTASFKYGCVVTTFRFLLENHFIRPDHSSTDKFGNILNYYVM